MNESFKLSSDDGGFLIRLSRRAISSYLEKGERITPPQSTPKKLLVERGVFVTLNTHRMGGKELRGCIGYPEPRLPLAEATVNSAVNAATGDPRFPPVAKGEMDRILVEVSVLTQPMLIKVDSPREYVESIAVGKDGLIVERSGLKGLLLPQVPVEWGWGEEEFLSNCCTKAGLYPDAWLIEGTRIYKFSCIIAREVSPSGEVVIEDMREATGVNN